MIVAAILIIGSFVYGVQWYKNRSQSHLFNGEVVSVADSGVITVSGIYPREDGLQPVAQKNIPVQTDAKTKFVKTLIYLPSTDELKATNGRYEPSKLKRENSDSTLAELKKSGQGTVISVVANTNVYNQDAITPQQIKEINFILPIYPILPKPAK